MAYAGDSKPPDYYVVQVRSLSSVPHCGVYQWLDYRPHKPKVAGSSPAPAPKRVYGAIGSIAVSKTVDFRSSRNGRANFVLYRGDRKTMKLISVKKLKDLMSHCTERDEFLVDKETLADLIDEFGDDYFISEFSRTTMELTNENKKDYSNGWRFRTP